MSYTKPIISSVHFSKFTESMPDLSAKTFVITGTTSGTGRVAARTLAEKGGRVVMLNRPSPRAQKIQEEIATAFPDAFVETIDCDLQSFESVRSAIAAIKEKCHDGIYALINNAGIMAMPDEATKDGFDTQMQTNHLSHFLLTNALLPFLEKAAETHGDARIVNHSSVARLSVKRLEAKYLEKNGGNLGGNGSSMMFGGGRWVRYGQTKFANAAFTAALHQKLQAKGSKVKALVAHPGFANTDLQVTTSSFGGMSSFFTPIMMKFFSQSAEDGTLGILSCAVLPDAQSGEFYGPGSGLTAMKGQAKPFALEKQYNNQETIDLIWSKSCAAVGEEFSI